ncbi:MAG: prefoldin subunit beta [Thermoprotei archaeon]|nr:prefoldin subunit beta [Thermoprotei archaeon]
MLSVPLDRLPPHVRSDLERLSQIQEMLNNVVLRRQQYEIQLKEIENAINELNQAPDDVTIFKNVGNILIKTTKQKALEELQEAKETVELHIKTLQRQENLLRKQFDDLRKKVQKELSGAGGGEGA